MEIKKHVARFMSLPLQVVLDQPQVVLTGNNEAVVENYKKIVAYALDHVRILTSAGEVAVRGKNLTLAQLTQESITVKGQINSVGYS